MRRTIYIILIIATLFLAFGYTVSLGGQTAVPNVHGASRTITLSGAFSTGWNGSNPGPTITLTQGDSVILNLVSADGAPHTFVIDVAHAGVVANPNCNVDKCSNQFPPSYPFMFAADMAPGRYTYYCGIHLQHMVGTIVVQSGTSGGPDFSATSNPTSLSVAQGSSVTASISLISLNGFSGTVALSATVSPPGPAVSLSSTSVTLSPNMPASSSLTVSAASGGAYSTSVPDGAYTITVTETSGSVSHSTTILVNIGATMSGPTSPSSGSSMPLYGSGMSGTALLAAAGVLISVVVVAAIAVVVRSRARS